jgi:hypothetical protein
MDLLRLISNKKDLFIDNCSAFQGHQAMSDMIRLAGFVLILVATVVTAVLQQPDEENDLGLKLRTVSYWLNPAEERSDELTITTQAEMGRLEEKLRALQKLLDGRATLFETAAVFHRLNQRAGMQLFHDEPEFAGRSLEELACIQVIGWAANDPRGTPLFVARLEEELRLYKEEYGSVILPDVKPDRTSP